MVPAPDPPPPVAEPAPRRASIHSANSSDSADAVVVALESLGSSGAEPPPNDPTETLVQWMAKIELLNPEHRRAVTAGCALQWFARPWRIREQCYHYSFQTRQIHDFWSHSWRTSVWQKAGLLLIWYNGVAAFLISTLGVFLVLVLACLGLTPAYSKQPWLGPPLTIGPWCSLTGPLLYSLAFTLWRSRRRVWLDWICIHQTDMKLQECGLLSLGGNIGNAKSMLILWDETWIERLWCIFELATFLRSHPDATKNLIILPIFFWPFCVANFWVGFAVGLGNVVLPFNHPLSFVSGTLGMLLVVFVLEKLMHEFYCSLALLEERLRKFSLNDAKCACCDNDHKGPYGQEVRCDRHVLIQVMCLWFGSEAEIESHISTIVADALREKLLGKFPLPYWMMVMCQMPVLWAYMDIFAARARDEQWEEAAAVVLDCCSWFLNLIPAISTFVTCLVRWTHSTASCRQTLFRWMSRLAAILMHVAGQLGVRVCHHYIENYLHGKAVFFGISLLPAFVAWRLRSKSA
ncbi:unnamed protein product [Effrenium voratum]|uniref:Uncharacterized protein n=1 Tax=Effrenium voratum TaxID=2562239 RepID=A0AA36IJ82_9DINO|nr:unnamed protein product [Effrenium voratum]